MPLKATKHDGKTIFTESDGGLVSALKSYFEKDTDARFTEKFWVGAADFTEKNGNEPNLRARYHRHIQ
ncbi:MAG: hypothetical protein WDO15_08775 [Bacteroidota bacterium]